MSEFLSLAPPAVLPARQCPLSASEWRQVVALYGFIGVLHLLGWGAYLHYGVGSLAC